jgi:hypothetical protein
VPHWLTEPWDLDISLSNPVKPDKIATMAQRHKVQTCLKGLLVEGLIWQIIIIISVCYDFQNLKCPIILQPNANAA